PSLVARALLRLSPQRALRLPPRKLPRKKLLPSRRLPLTTCPRKLPLKKLLLWKKLRLKKLLLSDSSLQAQRCAPASCISLEETGVQNRLSARFFFVSV